MTYIYALIDPRTSEVRYVGKADNPKLRLQKHLRVSSLKDNTHKNTWLRELISQGFTPGLVILAEASARTWAEEECFWIAYLTFIGCRLTNGTTGGDGGSFPGEKNPMFGRKGELHPCYQKKRPAELMARIRAKITGQKRKFKPETLEAFAERSRQAVGEKNPFFGHKHSEETKAKWSAKRKGTKLTPHQLEALARGRETRWAKYRAEKATKSEG